MAGLLSRGQRGDSADRDADLLIGFVEPLRTIDLTHTRIVGKLIDAGARRVKDSRRDNDAADGDVDLVRVAGSWSLPPQHPWDHPDWVLSRAVAAAVIDPDECLLISATRLDRVDLQTIADKSTRRRRRAPGGGAGDPRRLGHPDAVRVRDRLGTTGGPVPKNALRAPPVNSESIQLLEFTKNRSGIPPGCCLRPGW
jgi:hypothetical protein